MDDRFEGTIKPDLKYQTDLYATLCLHANHFSQIVLSLFDCSDFPTSNSKSNAPASDCQLLLPLSHDQAYWSSFSLQTNVEADNPASGSFRVDAHLRPARVHWFCHERRSDWNGSGLITPKDPSALHTCSLELSAAFRWVGGNRSTAFLCTSFPSHAFVANCTSKSWPITTARASPKTSSSVCKCVHLRLDFNCFRLCTSQHLRVFSTTQTKRTPNCWVWSTSSLRGCSKLCPLKSANSGTCKKPTAFSTDSFRADSGILTRGK